MKPSQWLDRLWPSINQRRWDLINKKYLGGLTADETAELDTLQEYTDFRLEPFYRKRIAVLKSLLRRG